MRLDFNVLWVEDQQDRVQSQKQRIDQLIRKEGFRLSVQFASSVETATKSISDHIYGDHVDLILMDFDLGAGGRGDAGIVAARKLMPYKEIIFYSAQSADLRAILEKVKVDGVYISSREDLPTDVDGIFQMLVKKVIDIEHSRGIVMGATSDIDHFINDCLVALFNACDDAGKSKILGEVADRLVEIRKNFEKDAAVIAKATHVAELVPKHATYSSFHRLNLLREMFKLLKLHDDKAKALSDYAYTTMRRRNDLAHVRVRVDGFSRKLFDRDGKEVTADEMRALRVALLDSQELFESIHKSLPGRAPKQ